MKYVALLAAWDPAVAKRTVTRSGFVNLEAEAEHTTEGEMKIQSSLDSKFFADGSNGTQSFLNYSSNESYGTQTTVPCNLLSQHTGFFARTLGCEDKSTSTG